MFPTIRFLTVSFFFLAAAGCQPSDRNPGGCTQDTDCDTWERCDDGECVAAVDCQRDADCLTGERCDDGACVLGNRCDSDTDCQAPTPSCDPVAGFCVACAPECAGSCCGDDGCGGQCPDVCDRTGQTCDQQTCSCQGECQPNCTGRECGPDGCDGECGPGCADSEVCSAQGECLCVPDCAGRVCGPDGCGGECGPGCAAGQACDDDGRCMGCQPECAGRECGPDGCGGECGPGCALGEACDADGQCAVCEPDCAGRECGPDGCGGQCGPGCAANEGCNADGQCVCQPDCAGRECGADGCGGQCAPGCAADELCNADGQCVACQPECGQRQCGPDPVCGVSCGQCDPDESCNLDGQCGPWCELGETRCTADGYGFQACGPDQDDPELNSFGPRIPCALGDACQAGACVRQACLEVEAMVLLDRSSSMLAGGTWDWVVAGLLSQVGTRQERTYLGYREFPSGGGCSVGSLLPMSKNNLATIEGNLTDPEMDSATPISAALQGFVELYGDPNDGQTVILLTDGDETCASQDEALAAAAGLFRAGVSVEVIALTQTANRAFLDQLAAAGGTGHSHLVTTQAELVAALDAIFLDLDACHCYAGPDCEDAELFSCSEDELNYTFTQECPMGCAPGGIACETCTPGQIACEGLGAFVCRNDGLDFEYLEDCPLGCVDGSGCVLCQPGERVCVDDEVWRCRDDRKDYVYESTCPYSCQGGACYGYFFFDDFEDQDFSDWTTGVGSYTREIVSGGADGTGYALSLTGGDGVRHNGVIRELSAMSPDRISFWVRSGSTSNDDGQFAVGTDLDPASMAYFYTEGSGELKLLNHDTGQSWTGGSYSAGYWYHIEFRNIDWVNMEFDFYVGGVLQHADIPFRNAAYGYVSQISLFNYHDSTAAWDEILFE